jgi:hypothetical protein
MRDLTRREFLEKSLKTGSAFGIAASGFSGQRLAIGGMRCRRLTFDQTQPSALQ